MSVRAFLLKSAWTRASIPVLLMVIVGISSNSLVAEITSGSVVRWHLMFQTSSFYILLVATIVTVSYQIAVVRYDKEVARGFTPRQYEAAIRNGVAEEVSKRSKKLIRDGNIEQLERETEAFKRLYGEAEK